MYLLSGVGTTGVLGVVRRGGNGLGLIILRVVMGGLLVAVNIIITRLSEIESPTLIDWISPFPF